MLVVGFFSLQFLCYMQQRNWILFHSCLLHWVTATNVFFVWGTEPLLQTEIVFVALSHCDKQNKYILLKNVLKCLKMSSKMQNKAYKSNKKPKKSLKVPKSWAFLTLLAIFWQHIQILLVGLTQCDNFFVCSFQWFSATHTISVCHSDSVQQINWQNCSIY